jgi:hypothetical protein
MPHIHISGDAGGIQVVLPRCGVWITPPGQYANRLGRNLASGGTGRYRVLDLKTENNVACFAAVATAL